VQRGVVGYRAINKGDFGGGGTLTANRNRVGRGGGRVINCGLSLRRGKIYRGRYLGVRGCKVSTSCVAKLPGLMLEKQLYYE
jgi:hypothetical protein